jgi:hypothetical protein
MLALFPHCDAFRRPVGRAGLTGPGYMGYGARSGRRRGAGCAALPAPCTSQSHYFGSALAPRAQAPGSDASGRPTHLPACVLDMAQQYTSHPMGSVLLRAHRSRCAARAAGPGRSGRARCARARRGMILRRGQVRVQSAFPRRGLHIPAVCDCIPVGRGGRAVGWGVSNFRCGE